MVKIDKKDLKSPDKFQQELQKGFQWTTQHSKMVGIAIIGLMVIGAGISAKTYLDDKKEEELQARYFQIEKKMMEKKDAFEKAALTPPPAAADAKKKTPAAPPVVAGEKASGDFDKDYGTLAQDMSKIIDEAPKSKAAKMAALNLSDVQIQYQKLAEAQSTLQKVKTGSRDLLSALVQTQLGTVQADLKDCNSAVSTWQQVLANSSAKALHGNVKLKSGLCYESLKDFAKAEKLYTEAKNEDKDSVAAKTAEKYIRLLPTTKKD